MKTDRGTTCTLEAFAPAGLDAGEQHQERPEKRGNGHCDQDQQAAPAADIARHQAIETKLEQGCHANRRGSAKDEKQLPGGRHVELAQPQRHGQPQRHAQTEKVAGRKDYALGIAPEAHQSQEILRADASSAALSWNLLTLSATKALPRGQRRPLRASSPRIRSRLCLHLFAIIARGIRAVNQSVKLPDCGAMQTVAPVTASWQRDCGLPAARSLLGGTWRGGFCLNGLRTDDTRTATADQAARPRGHACKVCMEMSQPCALQ